MSTGRPADDGVAKTPGTRLSSKKVVTRNCLRPITSMGTEPSDRELLPRLGADPVAFELFYRRHVDRVIRFAARRASEPADVADVTAATFVAAVGAAATYDPARGEPGAWLLGVAARLMANEQRRRLREAAALRRLKGRALLDDDDIERLEAQIDASARAQAARDVLWRLPPRSREALLLVGTDGLSSAEAAAVLGVSTLAFRMRLSRARRRLARLLTPNGHQSTADADERAQVHGSAVLGRPEPPVKPEPMVKEVSL